MIFYVMPQSNILVNLAIIAECLEYDRLTAARMI